MANALGDFFSCDIYGHHRCASARPNPGISTGNTRKELIEANLCLKRKRSKRRIQENANWENFKYKGDLMMDVM